MDLNEFVGELNTYRHSNKKGLNVRDQSTVSILQKEFIDVIHITNSEKHLKMHKRLEIDKGLRIGKSNLDAEPGNQFRVCLWNKGHASRSRYRKAAL
jgi:hypothetical protein